MGRSVQCGLSSCTFPLIRHLERIRDFICSSARPFCPCVFNLLLRRSSAKRSGQGSLSTKETGKTAQNHLPGRTGAQAESGTRHSWSQVPRSQVPWAVPVQVSLRHVSSDVQRVRGGLRGRRASLWGPCGRRACPLAPLIVESRMHCNIQRYRKVKGMK